tara:strand:- start:1269 stop:1598 length:330 start_codon:yes stop_codon:yes gene_type:complete
MSEEEFLLKKFKEKYVIFCNKTPAFFPNFGNYKKSKCKFSIKKILRQEYSSTLSVIVAFIYIDILMYYLFYVNPFDYGHWQKYIYILIVSVSIAVLLKITRTNSNILNE